MTLKTFELKTFKAQVFRPRPKSGFGCPVCAKFARQRSGQYQPRVEQVRLPQQSRERAGNDLNDFHDVRRLKPGPKSGLDCLMCQSGLDCLKFAQQWSGQYQPWVEQVRFPQQSHPSAHLPGERVCGCFCVCERERDSKRGCVCVCVCLCV
jgi:hypothetical protein